MYDFWSEQQKNTKLKIVLEEFEKLGDISNKNKIALELFYQELNKLQPPKK